MYVSRASRSAESCTLQLADNVVAFLHDEAVEAGAAVRAGDTVVHRCQDIGKFVFTGSVRRRCEAGQLGGEAAVCRGLNQHVEYSRTAAPTILFRHDGSISQTNDGRLMVFPGTTLHMECLFMKAASNILITNILHYCKFDREMILLCLQMYGTPSWTFPNTTTRSHLQGWAKEPMRDATLEYRLSIYNARATDSGRYTCNTPNNRSHSVTILVADVR